MSAVRRARPAASVVALSALMAALALAASAARADAKAEMADARAHHQQERAACKSMPADQGRAGCMREADAAFELARQGAKDDPAAVLTRNANKRCDALPEEDRQACLSRMKGQGRTTGSVANGGIFRELVTTEPAQPASAATK